MSRIWILMFLTCCATASPADDRIEVRTASGSRIRIPCSIQDYNGREVVYQVKQQTGVQRRPRRDVLEVTTYQLPPHVEAKQLLAEGKAKDAFEKLETALEQERRAWVRREILATQIKCALWNGDRVTAGERFLAIFDSDPDTLYFPLMPLSWSDDRPSDDLARAARQWLAQTTNSAAQLLGASHLLTAPGQSEIAVKALKDLARDGHAEIQRFGQIQLWRVKTLSDDLSREELLRWERSFEEAGDALGGGPRYILGLGWQRRHNDVAAAAEWLWLPLVSVEDRWLAAEASWQAGQALERAGQKAEALAVYAEIIARFADTPYGSQAAAAQKRLKD